jgi:hypothetical protein
MNQNYNSTSIEKQNLHFIIQVYMEYFYILQPNFLQKYTNIDY